MQELAFVAATGSLKEQLQSETHFCNEKTTEYVKQRLGASFQCREGRSDYMAKSIFTPLEGLTKGPI